MTKCWCWCWAKATWKSKMTVTGLLMWTLSKRNLRACTRLSLRYERRNGMCLDGRRMSRLRKSESNSCSCASVSVSCCLPDSIVSSPVSLSFSICLWLRHLHCTISVTESMSCFFQASCLLSLSISASCRVRLFRSLCETAPFPIGSTMYDKKRP